MLSKRSISWDKYNKAQFSLEKLCVCVCMYLYKHRKKLKNMHLTVDEVKYSKGRKIFRERSSKQIHKLEKKSWIWGEKCH